MLEDYYDRNPDETKKFLGREDAIAEWDGTMSPEYEAAMQARLKKVNERNKVDIAKYQTKEENLSEEQVQDILANVGKNLPKSQVVTKLKDGAEVLGSDEFDDAF